MSPLTDIGLILSQVYQQSQKKTEAQPADTPRLAGGLWGAFNFEEAAAKYKQQIEQQYGFLHILGHNKPVPLEGVFTDVYLYERPLAQRRLDLDLEANQQGVEQRNINQFNGLSFVRKERHLFILGQPGVGKTTFLKHIALQAAKGDLLGVPIFISLKMLADSQKSLLDFMVQEMQICNFPEPTLFLRLMLQLGQMLILLDGLDEVTQSQESSLNLIQAIENLTRQYYNNHFLITCRTAVTDYQFPRFTTVEIADFSSEQVAIFVKKWFQYEPERGDSYLYELEQPEHSGLRNLARIPLLLNLLCLTYQDLDHFPQRRTVLYEEALNALLVKWDSSRRIRRDEAYRQLDLGRKRRLLAHIAAATFSEGKYFIPTAEIVDYILNYLKTIPELGNATEADAEAMLQAIEAHHGIIVEQAKGIYGFAHLAFQEYFTAQSILEAGRESWIALFAHCTNPQWREVFRLTSSLLRDTDDFCHSFANYLDQMITHNPELLAMLTWTNQKAIDTGTSARLLLLKRMLYVYLACTLDRSLNLDVSLALTDSHARIRTLALALDDTLYLNNALGLALDLVRARSRGRKFVRSRPHALAFILPRARNMAQTLDPLIALDFTLAYASLFALDDPPLHFIELAQELSRTQGLASLQAALNSLAIPARDAPKHKHIQFAELLWQLAQQERGLQKFELTDEETNILTGYIQGTALLVECLNQAAVKDRDAILSRLLAPPAAAANFS